MFKQLIDYADQVGLTAKPGYQKDYIKWFVTLDPKGTLLGIAERSRDIKAKGDLFQCPKLSQPMLKAGGKGARHFLVDTTAVVSMLGLEKLKTESEQEKLRVKHAFFVNLIAEAAAEVSILEPIAVALQNEKTVGEIRLRLEQQSPKAKTTQNISFAVKNELIVERSDWQDWYQSHLQRLRVSKASKSKKSSSREMVSLASGTLIEPANTHPALKGLSEIGGNASVLLASFKPPSFRHFGLKQSHNAAVSAEEAATYSAAANLLIRESRSLAMGKVAFWYVGEAECPLSEDEQLIIDEDILGTGPIQEEPELTDEEKKTIAEQNALQSTSQAKSLLDAYRSGMRPEFDKARFIAISLDVNASRLVVRDYMEGSFVSLLASIESWLDDLEISKLDNRSPAKSPTLKRVISCPLPPKTPTKKYADWIKPVTKFREPLWRAAIGCSSLESGDVVRRPVPQSAIEMLLSTIRAAVLNGEYEDAIDGSPAARSRLYCRMGLMKMFLIRNGDMNVNAYLNEDHPSAAYQCGRLLAVLANVQQQALGDVGANVVQRFYARASTAPADALGPIIRLSNAHLNKLETGLSVMFRNKIATIFGKINTNEELDLPEKLDATGQSLFALGYYQQIANDRQVMLDNAAKKKQKNKDQSKEISNE